MILMTPGAFADGVPQTAEAFSALRFHRLTGATVAATLAESVAVAIVASARLRVILLIHHFDQTAVRTVRRVSTVSNIDSRRTATVSNIDSRRTAVSVSVAFAMGIRQRAAQLTAGQTSRTGASVGTTRFERVT